jgi:chorismate mutase-like protein
MAEGDAMTGRRTEKPDELATLRARIDGLDEELVRLLNERAACALAVGRAKHALGLAIYQPDRERDVLEHVAAVNTGPLDAAAIRRLFERIIDEARRLERLAEGE